LFELLVLDFNTCLRQDERAKKWWEKRKTAIKGKITDFKYGELCPKYYLIAADPSEGRKEDKVVCGLKAKAFGAKK
jgi:hypothetical protein